MIMHSKECEQFRKNNTCFACDNCDKCIKIIAKFATKVFLKGTPFEDKN